MRVTELGFVGECVDPKMVLTHVVAFIVERTDSSVRITVRFVWVLFDVLRDRLGSCKLALITDEDDVRLTVTVGWIVCEIQSGSSVRFSENGLWIEDMRDPETANIGAIDLSPVVIVSAFFDLFFGWHVLTFLV